MATGRALCLCGAHTCNHTWEAEAREPGSQGQSELQEALSQSSPYSSLNSPRPVPRMGYAEDSLATYDVTTVRAVWEHNPRGGPEAGSHTSMSGDTPRTGGSHGHTAQSGMKTAHLAGKWAEVGGAIVDVLELPSFPDSSDRKAQLTNQRQRRLPQEGLKSLPKQIKSAPAWPCSLKKKQGRGRKWLLSLLKNPIKTNL